MTRAKAALFALKSAPPVPLSPECDPIFACIAGGVKDLARHCSGAQADEIVASLRADIGAAALMAWERNVQLQRAQGAAELARAELADLQANLRKLSA